MYEAESRTSRPKQEGSTEPALPTTATLAEDEKRSNLTSCWGSASGSRI
jgi:hypothetical protein